VNLAFGDLEADIVQGLYAWEGLGDISHFQNGRIHEVSKYYWTITAYHPTPNPSYGSGGEIEETGSFGSKMLSKLPDPLISFLPFRRGKGGSGRVRFLLYGRPVKSVVL
jgi:hypothetical protein